MTKGALMKINILFPIKETSSGGGNQFLKALKKELIRVKCYGELEEADIVLFNSHQFTDEVLQAKKKYPNKVYVHRVDGPIRLYNGPEDKRDYITNVSNKYIADATVFQSNWSRQQNKKMGMKDNLFETTICNAPDKTIFYTKKERKIRKNEKVKIIAASWSSNWNKGFDVYQYLDNNLDFNKYQMTFVGNSPVVFKNIQQTKALDSHQMAKMLNQHDIYLTASRRESCSNSLLEALSCGLPVIAYNDGGNPEIIGTSGYTFNQKEEILDLLNKTVENYRQLIDKIEIADIEVTAQKYIDFFKKILNEYPVSKKKITFLKKEIIKSMVFYNKCSIYFKDIKRALER